MDEVAGRQSTSPAIWEARHLRIATEAAGIALWSWNVDTDEIALDEKAHRMWGLPLGAGLVTFEALSSHIHPEDLDRVRAAFTATRDIFGPYEVDFRIIHGRDVRWISARGRGDDEGIVGRVMFGVFLDVTGRKLAEEGRELLALEMGHRVKNLFSMASALTRIASRSAATTQGMAHDIQRRLEALGNAHELIRPSLSIQKKAVSLDKLLTTLLAAYDDSDTVGKRIRMTVPELPIGEASITILALVIHELATNSIKYGALSTDTGTIEISSIETADDFSLRWVESGGPVLCKARGLPGFGTSLLTNSIAGQLGGDINFDWREAGLDVTLRVRKARLAT
jgi:two-component sensor histidine kinase